jgi:adenine-specific DNA-methyltransferase
MALGQAASSIGLASPALAAARASKFPRLRYMGSKYRLVPELAEVFAEIGGVSALDAFSGSGVVAYTLKALGYAVTASDFLSFPTVIAAATVANQGVQLSSADIAKITGPAADNRDFIQRTFDGLYFNAEDRAFLDSAWSHIAQMTGDRRALAVASLVLAAAKKQPRGVFTFTDLRYDDGRRDLHLPLREHFVAAAQAYNAVVFDSGVQCRVTQSDVADLDQAGYDLERYSKPR